MKVDATRLIVSTSRSTSSIETLGCAAPAHLKEWLKGQIIESVDYAHAEGIDKPEITEWKWPLAN